MGNRHLTDDEIQEYLDTRSSELTDRVEKHAASCDRCGSMLQHYVNLYSGLDDDSDFDLSVDFTKNVIEAAGLTEHESFLNRFSSQILAATGLAVAAVAFVILSDVSLLLRLISNTGMLLESALTKPFEGNLGAASGTIGLILPGIFAVLAMWLLDRHVLHAKKKPSSLMI
jgi:anti-sigma factor RsiW